MRILFNSNIGSMQGNQTVERTSYWQVDSLSDMVTLVQFPEPSLEECHQTLSYMDKLLGYCLGLTSIILMVPTETVISEIEELFELIDHLSTTMETIDPSSSWWSRILIIFDDKETDETMVAEHRAGILRIQLPCIQEKYRLEKAPAFMFINSNASSFLDETDSARYQLECQRIFRYLVQSHHQDGWWRVSSYNESVEQDYSSSEEDIEIVKLIEPKKREPLPRTKIILNH
ncbi:hypothetical protein CLU79DRAFT_741338 [Phycomyces nitens]|nr:hypothetical protein CLU79DRAFT_741338 [Phycomyces nitens]